jgi:threonine synthase
MFFIETRGNDGKKKEKVQFSEAILSPSASFGGLYVPENLPKLDLNEIKDLNYKNLALHILDKFGIDIEKSVLEEAVSLYDNFDDSENPVPVKSVGDDLYISELYHGPTRAFKDMALQPFGKVLSSLAQKQNENYLILAATSGDTGPATLHTFRNRENTKVVCLYPDGGTSDVQRLQMVTEEGENLKVIGIKGSFDDAQNSLKRLLKSEEFLSELEKKNVKLSAANSVNFGRIIFQTIYHVWSYFQLVKKDEIEVGNEIYITVPSGNFGNALGGFYAREMGLPIRKIFISSNENNILTDLIATGKYSLIGRNVKNTKSPAMDILKSSNVERVLFHLFGNKRTKELMDNLEEKHEYELSTNELSELQKLFSASFSTDSECFDEIDAYFDRGYLMDPHTATVVKAHNDLRDDELPNIAYSTAEWTKFSPSIVEALKSTNIDEVGKKVSDFDALEMISERTGEKVVEQISDLFTKEISHKTVIEISELEKEILNFV